MSGRLARMLFGRPTKVKKGVLIGVSIGLAFGVLEALVTSIGAADFWRLARLHFAQFGFACPFLGGILGYIVARRIDRRHRKRLAEGHCCHCGYNLTGNVSGVCPECGERI